MKRPTIILRFKQNVAPPTPSPPPPHTSPPPPAQPAAEKHLSKSSQHRKKQTRRSPLSPENNTEIMTRRGPTRRTRRIENPTGDNDRDHAETTGMSLGASLPTAAGKGMATTGNNSGGEGKTASSPSTSSTTSAVSPGPTLKRKRDIPKSIGGGKGDLKPSSMKRPKRPSAGASGVSADKATSPALVAGSGKKEEEKRVLRSQDTSKKSEFEEWFEDPELNDDIQMPINVRETSKATGLRVHTPARHQLPNAPAAAQLLNSPLNAPPTEDPNIVRIRSIPVQIIDLEEELRKSDSRHTRFLTDPLADEVYISAHLAAERREKRSKNIERDLLHHNAAKIESDLEKLRGPEWIKAIGLSQALVARLTKKELEERKEPLVANLEATLEKYKAWSNSEKRKRRTSSSPKGSQERDSEEIQTDSEQGASELGSDVEESDGDHHKKSSWRGTSSKKPSSLSGPPPKVQKKAKSPKVEPEFTSFYNSPAMRQQAVSNRRRSSRMQTAFGQPLPSIEEKEFALPAELLASASAARHTRARKRLSR